MAKYLLILTIVFSGFLVAVQAQEDDPFASIAYPVAELGNCTDKDDCLNYCDDPDNMEACLNFAEQNNLIPEEDIEMGRKMLAAGETDGPGGCRGARECGTYCDNMSNLKECLAFAEENNLIPPEELAEAKKVAAAIDRGIAPPPCNSKTECDSICRLPENMRQCITFAKEAGLMPPEELEEAEKVLAALEKGVQPPACGGKDECDEYCGQEEHFEECITFAEAAGFMSADEAVMARKTGGKGPGGCRGKDTCEAFCEDPANGEVCLNFAIENGFMSAEEGEQAKKMMAAGMNIMEGGPGGCKGKDECEAFCNDMANMEECVSFAERAGMMSPEDAEQARQGAAAMMQGGPGGCRGEECRTYCDDVSHNEECVSWALESGMIPPEEAERMNQMREQFQQQSEFGPPPEGMPLEPFEQFGPPPEGEQFRPPEGFEEMMPEGMEPGQFQEQFQQQFQQQYQQQYQEQYQQQYQQQMQQQMPPEGQMMPMEQFAPPPITEQPPQSFWDKTKNFLGGAGLIIGR